MTRVAAIVSALALADPAAALVIDGCPDGDAAGTRAAVGAYSAYAVAEGFVSYNAVELATDEFLDILEYCPERRQIVLRSGTGINSTDVDDAARRLYDEMIQGDKSFTMSEMVTGLRAMGAVVDDRVVDYQSCGCQLHGGGS